MSLSVKYLGLDLKNPVIIGSSGLTDSVDKIIKLEKNGAGAVVLKSLFEEQILIESVKNIKENQTEYPGVDEYIAAYTRDHYLKDYLRLVEESKQAVDIPVIANINCISDNDWISFATKIEKAGADALELNVAILPSDINVKSKDNEKKYFSIIEKVRAQISIPIALKMGDYSSGLANLILQLSYTGNVDSFVLFNRYYRPDIDIDRLKVITSSLYSMPSEISTSLRWIALLSGSIKKELVASTGVHDGRGVVKQILAGASAVQMVSAIYKKGAEYISIVLNDIEKWMKEKGFESIDDFKGKVSYDQAKNPTVFERTQFMRYFSNIK